MRAGSGTTAANLTNQPTGGPMNTRTIAIIALIIAVIVLLLLLL
jgi:hypothetical protein